MIKLEALINKYAFIHHNGKIMFIFDRFYKRNKCVYIKLHGSPIMGLTIIAPAVKVIMMHLLQSMKAFVLRYKSFGRKEKMKMDILSIFIFHINTQNKMMTKVIHIINDSVLYIPL